MKKFLFLFLFLFTTNCFATDYTTDSRCKTAYLLQETSGNAVDSSSANNAGNLGAGAAAPTWVTNGCAAFSNKSLSFDGGDTLTPANNGNTYLSLTKGTITIWYKANVAASNDYLFDFEVSGSYFTLGFDTHTDLFFNHRYNYGTVHAVNIAVADITTDTAWHFVTIRWNSAGNIDGVAARTLSISYGGGYANDVDVLDTGSISGSGIIGNSWTGQIDEVAFFNDVLTTTELSDIQTNGLKPSGGGETGSLLNNCVINNATIY